MRNRLLQLVCLLAFAAIALPGHAGLHLAMGVEHQHASQTNQSVGKSEHSIKHARCKHHYHDTEQSPGPISVPESQDDDCPICDFFAQPLIFAVAAQELSLAMERADAPLADEVVCDISELGTPPARGPPCRG